MMKKEFDNRKWNLQTLLNELSSSIDINGKKYFHIKTVGNLIYHFEEVKTENDKNWVYETLVEYFKKCSENLVSIDRDMSRNLFNQYLDKITDYYHNNLGFTVLMNRTLVYLIYLLVLGLCYYFSNLFVVITVASFFIFQIIRTFKKYKDKQVYGLFW